MKPCNLFAVAGYEMFGRRCNSGMHFLHKEFPHGKVTGSCRGYEHCGHCANLTICLASLEASRAAFDGMISVREVFGVFEEGGDRRGMEDMKATLSSAGHLDCPSSSSRRSKRRPRNVAFLQRLPAVPMSSFLTLLVGN